MDFDNTFVLQNTFWGMSRGICRDIFNKSPKVVLLSDFLTEQLATFLMYA